MKIIRSTYESLAAKNGQAIVGLMFNILIIDIKREQKYYQYVIDNDC